jgi:cell division protein ZapA (FtsZ GTPase activity inhibitor)
MAQSEPTDITIYGRKFRIALEGLTPLETVSCGNTVEERMRQIAAERNIADSSKLAILTALEIAAELMRVRNELENLNPADEQRVEKMIVDLENAVEGE